MMAFIWFAAGLLVGWMSSAVVMIVMHAWSCAKEEGHDWLDYAGRAPKVGR